MDISSEFGDLANINIGKSLSNVTDAINEFVVAPIAAFGIAGFIFNAQGEATAILSTDITDHYAEDNRVVQDQIAIHPKRITLKGYVGELIYNTAGDGPSFINTLAEKLVAITAYQPPSATQVTQIKEAVQNPLGVGFTGLLGTASNIYGLVQNTLGAFGPTQNQQNAYSYFKALMQSKTLMGVQTPWEFMTNMAIESIVAIQSENSIWISDFAITLKEIRIASTSTVPQSNSSAKAGVPGIAGAQSTPAVISGDAGIQQAPPTNLGNITGLATVSQLGDGDFDAGS